jgi:tRNA G37 N-methylase Trm5
VVKFREQLREKLKEQIPAEFVDLLPAGFQNIDFAGILNLDPKLWPYKDIIGRALLELVPSLKSSWLRTGRITGQFRKPDGLEFICGDPTTEIEHHENNIRYRFDFTQIMFSKGNVTERKYLPELVRKDEIIVDMFAGIGYFSLCIAKFAQPKQIYAIELNPVSYQYLKKNIEINKLTKSITPIEGDCSIEVPKLAESGLKADRVIMGVFPAPYQYLPHALLVAKPIVLSINWDLKEFQEKAKTTYKFSIYDRIGDYNNTIIHFEGVTMGKTIDELYSKATEVINSNGFKWALLAFRFVKSFGPKMWHLVLDFAVGV